ncbi:wax ester/triacylglycerol synthase family O-acyltransferase [Actinokineospora sp. UTMC 2448]|uniref:wax ester/triacylglycerol synthase family O-acyltransferase n=1 Tax=Actinokineospora sp. UTMC 2448 TaxID=2268449 RepID=UPI002164671B|nr:wax ester/triacylglycerol synthase family O-acyltransferase [Actinokineospora sp. UTMC 2448]UVS81729.1 putative diacylglycerol O-acyltransferase tgs3 [Actinokineospora sp. UTMC 2448]
MPDRLSAADAALLALEDPATPRHVGSVAVFRRPRSGFDYPGLVALVERRLPLAPHYRQRVAAVPGRLARPVWVDDPDFDVTHHVRRSALPRPGGDEQLFDLVARLMARPLDRSRPLWEAYLVEGLAGGRVALVTKSHQALVDGVRTVDFATVLLDGTPGAVEEPDEPWTPRTPPGAVRLLTDAVTDTLRSPAELVENARATVTDVVAAGARVADALGLRPSGPLRASGGRARRFAVARARLGDLRDIRAAHGGTVNDVVLAVVAGALRGWLRTRGEPLTAVRALVPVAVSDTPSADARLVDLPVAEPDPLARLRRVSAAMRGRGGVPAAVLRGMGGLHSLGARTAAWGRGAGLVVTNVPGPQAPLYAGRARMTEVFPVMPLTRGHALAVGVTSYDGGVYFGLTADRASVSDVDVLAGELGESVAELVKA